jgi:hypothetical protein
MDRFFYCSSRAININAFRVDRFYSGDEINAKQSGLIF